MFMNFDLYKDVYEFWWIETNLGVWNTETKIRV